jgi:hypothetical protein
MDRLQSLVLYFIGIGLHLVVNDYGLSQHHREIYSQSGRWILSAAIIVGSGFGLVSPIDPLITGSIAAFLAGGVLLNTFKEELPQERESHLGAFVIGIMSYSSILLVL